MRPMRTWIVDPRIVENVENLANLPELNSENLLKYIGDASMKSSSTMTLEFMAKYSLIPNERKCCACSSSMTLVKDSADKHFGLVWHCAVCKNLLRKTNKVRVRDDSFFENMKLTMEKVLFLAANWVENPGCRIVDVAKEHGINKEVAGNLHNWFRDLTQQWWERAVREAPGMLGGSGKVVELNESLLYMTKYIKGSLRPQIWVIAMIENASNRVAMVEVNERHVTTLLSVIENYIHPDTQIVSDGWAAYGGIENLRARALSRFQFLEPEDTPGSSWGGFKKQVKSFGDPADGDGHMCNYMFRKVHNCEKLLNYLMIEMKSYRRDMVTSRVGEEVRPEELMVKMEHDFVENLVTDHEVKQELDDPEYDKPIKTEIQDTSENSNDRNIHVTVSTGSKRVLVLPPGTEEFHKKVKVESEE